MPYSARVLLDSIGPQGVRLTTLEVTFPRFVLAEFNTHRTFCLDGDTQLYFDLPCQAGRGGTRRLSMKLREFYDKWHFGCAPRANKCESKQLAGIDPGLTYTAKELASAAGYAHYKGIDLLTRRVGMPRIEIPGESYRLRGADSISSIESAGTNRQPMAARLARMQLRSCDEDTGEIGHTTVRDVFYSGRKPVFRVTLKDGRQIVCSKDHQFLTDSGWQRLEDAVGLGLSPGGIATWGRNAEFAVNGIEAYQDSAHSSEPELVLEFLHAQPPSNRGRRYSNVKTRGTRGRARVRNTRRQKPYAPKPKRLMVRHFVPLESIQYLGERETYDIEVNGPFHNFVADGFIVHNSRNSASSRAIPTSKLLERVQNDPVLPLEWGRNQKGMSASDVLTPEEEATAKRIWLEARDAAVAHARKLMDLKVHKQELNRVLEPFLWHTVVVTATEWENFFALRCAPNAQPEIRAAAMEMRRAIDASTPLPVDYGQWHLPLLQDDERALPLETQKKISAARCARVSYLTHDGTREVEKDLELHDRLESDRHLSPFEHVATPLQDTQFHANFRGWVQMRAEIEAATWPSIAAR
jgi:thymidylate synthase ThyX